MVERTEDFPLDYPFIKDGITGHDIVLHNDFNIVFSYRKKLINVKIAKGFCCDGGSIPRCVWWVDAPLGLGFIGYLVHDALYMSELTSRKNSDLYLAQILELDGKLARWRKGVIYHSVNMFGQGIWDAHTDRVREYGRKYVTLCVV